MLKVETANNGPTGATRLVIAVSVTPLKTRTRLEGSAGFFGCLLITAVQHEIN